MNRHLNNDELLDQLYGIGSSEAKSHLLQCAVCAARYAAFERRRAEAATATDVPNDFLAAQRREVYARLGDDPNRHVRWAPAVAAALLLALGMFLQWPEQRVSESPAPAARAELTDEQLFSDVYSIEESPEPRAAAPIQGLFESVVSNVAEEGKY
ncbi:MAG TPA: hypothetical protein VH639_05995 [Bryobacteraceae bacterium]|jgi:anti-sigma factor RsiW